MDVVVFGSRHGRLPSGWSREKVVAAFGGTEIDASVGAAPEARLTIVAVFGGVRVQVPKGSRVTLQGLSLLGGRKVDVEPGDGPEITVSAWAVLGGVEVSDRPK